MKLSDHIKKSDKIFYSLEFFPPKDKENWPAFIETASQLKVLDPLFVSVTYGAGGSSQDNTTEISARLQDQCGYLAMPHLTCVGATREHIKKIIYAFQQKGINNVLALRGDPPAQSGKPHDWRSGDFSSSVDLIRFIRENFPEFGIAVAGYPVPHPEAVTFSSDRSYLAGKLTSGGDLVLTQLFFDVRSYIALCEAMALKGLNKPILPGVFTIQSLESLRHVFALSNATVPAKLFFEFEEANKKGGVEAVKELGLEFTTRLIRQLIDAGAPGIHLYTMNKSDLCIKIAERIGKLVHTAM